MGYKLLLTTAFLFTVATVFGQTTGSLKGILRDSTEHEVLKRATIKILRNDSSAAQETLSGDDGSFNITNIAAGSYILQISFSSYETRFSNFTIDSANSILNAGIIYMQPHAHELAEVVVETPPIIIKKDTFEFKAGAFSTKPNASAEDLLKKMPGIDVDKDGSIKAQMGVPDMRLPIQYALAFPKRIPNNFPRVDFRKMNTLSFEEPDIKTFRNLALAKEALFRGGNLPCIMNAANELAVFAFLHNRIGFLDITDIVEKTMEKVSFIDHPTLDEYFESDGEARNYAADIMHL